MHSRLSLLWGLLALIIGIEGFIYAMRTKPNPQPSETTATPTAQLANLDAVLSNPPPPDELAASASKPPESLQTPPQTSTIAPAKDAEEHKPAAAPLQSSTPAEQSAWTQGQATRVRNPYPIPPQTIETTTSATRNALVNIFCASSGTIQPISGSGVLIDPRGVILTNAHVAQYVLLSQAENANLSCIIRTGSPSRPAWQASVLYIPPVWVENNVKHIHDGQETRGMGEHDYALLVVTANHDGTPLSSGKKFPHLSVDTREAIGFLGDEVLSAGYPVEFLGSEVAEKGLYFFSSRTSIKQLLTFGTGTVDLISLGGVMEAQSGSSGGAVVNPWGKLIGVITTTSEGVTAFQRDMRALSLSYVSRDLQIQTGRTLEGFLQGDVHETAASFNATIAPGLIQLYLAHMSQ